MSEPVAWMWNENDGIAGSPITHYGCTHPHWGREATPLYTADAIREAVMAERERMVADGWRQCAKGQRTTQFCGQLEQAVLVEREAIIQACEDELFSYETDTFVKGYNGGIRNCLIVIRARGAA